MIITLYEDEIKGAILDYVKKQGLNTEGKDVSIYIEKDFSKASATIRFSEAKS